MSWLWMRVPIAVYSGVEHLGAMGLLGGDGDPDRAPGLLHQFLVLLGQVSRPSLSTARLITWKLTSMSRTFSTSRIQREVIQTHGHSGSNQKSATGLLGHAELLRVRGYDVEHNSCNRTRVFPTDAKLERVLPNLTRNQAIERAALVTVDNYQIVLDLTDGNGDPGERPSAPPPPSSSRPCPAPTPTSTSPPTPSTAPVLNGHAIDVSGYDESTGIPLRGLAKHNTLVVDADCRYSNTGEGLHRFVDPVDGEVYLYSQFETADAKRMFACFDQPDLKATFDVTVTAPAHWQVISNGATVAVEEDGKTRVHTFATTPRMSTYLVALIAGPYARWDDVYADEHGEIPLGMFCRSSLAEYMDAERLFTETKQGFGFYHTQLRGALRIRQVRPAVRPRVQRRRDGERRRGDVPRGLRLPQQGHPATATSAAPRPCCTRWRTCGSATW